MHFPVFLPDFGPFLRRFYVIEDKTCVLPRVRAPDNILGVEPRKMQKNAYKCKKKCKNIWSCRKNVVILHAFLRTGQIKFSSEHETPHRPNSF